jgi:hypothetical protein
MPRKWNATRQHAEQKRARRRKAAAKPRDPLRRDWGSLRTHAMDVPSQEAQP